MACNLRVVGVYKYLKTIQGNCYDSDANKARSSR